MIRRTPFDIPLALFVGAMCLGTFVVAWDPAAAQSKLSVIIAGVVVYYVLVWLPRQIGGRDMTRLIAIAAPTVLGVFFLLTFDWSYRIGKVSLFDLFMRILQAVRLPISVELLNSNSIGGLIAALIPFQAHTLFRSWSTRQPANRIIGAALLAFSFCVLILSVSRGAWSACALVATLWLVYRLVKRPALIALALAVIAVLVGIFAGRFLESAFSFNRLPVVSGSFDLATENALTGIGPANFAMPYSSYVIMTHVPFLGHAHNLYLDTWLEGGALGLLAMLLIAVMAVIQGLRLGEWRTAALCAIAIVAIHGLLDDSLYAYAKGAQVLMWIPLAIIARESPVPTVKMQAAQLALPAAVAAILAVSIALVSPIHSLWETNLGALAQTKLELPSFTYLKWGLQDKLRREGNLDYTEVRTHYVAALQLDPNNAMANRRLAQIEIATGNYDAAYARLLAAYSAAPNVRSTRQMLGEMYAINNQPDQAAVLWRTIDHSQSQLDMRLSWYRSFIKDDVRAGRMQAALTRLNGE